ncbi:MAG: hypothetical protein ABW124_04315 [Candidatus Thiodiazotropha sp. 6PLUC9]
MEVFSGIVVRSGFILNLLLLLSACGGSSETSYRVGGEVTGLTVDGLVLQINGGDTLPVAGDGRFSFAIELDDGAAYEVTIASQPSGQTCTVNNGTGTLSGAEITNVQINCTVQALSLTVSAENTKLLRFFWDDVGANHYRLLKNPDGISGFNQQGSDLTSTQVDEEISVHLEDWLNASYLIQACNEAGQCVDSESITISSLMLDTIGYLKGYETSWEDYFGTSVAVSGDGLTLAVGAPGDISPATGIDGEWSFTPDYKMSAGAVYLFARIDGGWQRQAYIKASNTDRDDDFGRAVSLSYDGNTLAVGAPGESSAATGVDGDQQDNSAQSAGAVYLFTRNADIWGQLAYLKASDSSASEVFGQALSLSTSGNRLSVGAAEKVYVFEGGEDVWQQRAILESSNGEEGDYFGSAVQLSGDGVTLAVGAHYEASSSMGVDGESDNSAAQSGAVYLFVLDGESWTQQAYIKSSNSEAGDRFGHSLSISDDGNLMVVGAWGEDSSSTGIGSDGSDNSAEYSGAAYLFERINSQWIESEYFKASNTGSDDYFGHQVAISGDGMSVAVGAQYEGSVARGVNGDQADDSTLSQPGAVYQFTRETPLSSWIQKAYVKAPDTTPGWEEPVCFLFCRMVNDRFGASLSISHDGRTLVVGAPDENSGKSDDMEDTSSPYSGALYIY